MRKIILLFTALFFISHSTTANAALQEVKPTVTKNIYNSFQYCLYLDNKPQGFFTTYNAAYNSALTEVKRKASRVIQIKETGNETQEIFLKRQFKKYHAVSFPWQIETSQKTGALFFSVSWEGTAELALITPEGKRISQKDFGTKYPNILSYYGHDGIDVMIQDPSPGIWKVWVLGKHKNPKIVLPSFNRLFSTDVNVTKNHQALTFATYWGNKFIEDYTPAKLFLADEKGKLYLMGSYNEKILTELVGYNGLAIEVNSPRLGKWKLLTLTTRPEIKNINFQLIDRLGRVNGELVKVTYDQKKNNYLFYWHSDSNVALPKVLFISALSKKDGVLKNAIIPLSKNPQDVPAEMLPKHFTYKYYITSPFSVAGDGLIKGLDISW